MKKYIIFSMIVGLFLTACDPNDDIYEAIKNDAVPYNEKGLSYTIQNEDYSFISELVKINAETKEDSLWADYLTEYGSFNDMYSAYKYIPEILTKNFPALKLGSSIDVTFNQYSGEMYGNIESITLSNTDYEDIGGTIADTLCFTENDVPNDYLPDLLLNKLPDAEINTYVEIFFKYPDINTTSGIFYKYNGLVWSEVKNSIVLTENDYSQMGVPGEHNNFTEDALPGDYLPQFLNLNFPYAQEGDEKIIVCNLYKYESSIYAISCIKNETSWFVNFPGVKKTSQFKHDGSVWYFDPAVEFTMTTDDYQILIDYVTNNPEIPNGYLDPDHPTTSEYYYGANSYYNNFYLKLYKRRLYDPLLILDGLTDEEAIESIWKRIKEGIVIMLQEKFPNAVPEIEGMEVTYTILFDTYDGTNKTYKIIYKCTSAGAPPSFEIIEDADDITISE